MTISSRSDGPDREPRDASAASRARDGRDYSGGLVGHKDRALGDSPAPAGTTHAASGAGDAGDGIPIGSALAAHRAAPTAGTGGALGSGPATLGARAGGERASTGHADANRNSREHGDSDTR